MRIGYHASHEQVSPRDLLRYVKDAERAGFEAAMCSDHFAPWSERQGHSGFAWSWLGAALEATQLSFGTVCAPGQRYHPAVVAQAAATLEQMYEGRFWLALGSGEYLNEHITGGPWPSKEARNRRLLESAEAIRRLFTGDRVSAGGLISVRDARLYVVPRTPPPLYAAALSPETAEWSGQWSDGLITAAGTPEEVAQVVEAYRRGGGRGKPVLLQVVVSYADSEEEALRCAHDQWRHAVLSGDALADLREPRDFDAATAGVEPEAVREKVFVSADPAEHVRHLRQFAGIGVDDVYVHSVGAQPSYLEAYGREVIPALRRA